MRFYEASFPNEGVRLVLGIADISEGFGEGFDENYKMVTLVNGPSSAMASYTLRYKEGTTLAPKYIAEKFGVSKGLAILMVAALQNLTEEFNIKWFSYSELELMVPEINRIG